jgi:hypothetical protein
LIKSLNGRVIAMTSKRVRPEGKKPNEGETKKISLQKKDFTKLKKNCETSTAEVELPELAGLLDWGNGNIPTVKVRQMTLNEYLTTRGESLNFVRNLSDKLLEAQSNRYGLDEDLLKVLKGADPGSRERIEVVTECLVEPSNISRADIIWFSSHFPTAVMKIYNKIMELTSKGAGLKKNSTN